MSGNDMSTKRKLLLVYSGGHAAAADDLLDLPRLQDALRARGAELEEFALGSDPDMLLDRLEAGAVPVVFRTT